VRRDPDYILRETEPGEMLRVCEHGAHLAWIHGES
jgi:hypothetical protein